ncbi:MAG: hypothetical protein B7733_20460 [Myxococcales bacterium FL481]|nr:MAG: hypothetical protein B7733_20460 [Myxococcales bacterium FL481]
MLLEGTIVALGLGVAWPSPESTAGDSSRAARPGGVVGSTPPESGVAVPIDSSSSPPDGPGGPDAQFARDQAAEFVRIGDAAFDQGAYPVAADAYQRSYDLVRAPARLLDLTRVHLRWYDAVGNPVHLRRSALLLRNYLSLVQRMPAVRIGEDTVRLVDEVESKLKVLEQREAGTSPASGPSLPAQAEARQARAQPLEPSPRAAQPPRRDRRTPVDARRAPWFRTGVVLASAGGAVLTFGAGATAVWLRRSYELERDTERGRMQWASLDCSEQPAHCDDLSRELDSLMLRGARTNRRIWWVGIPAMVVGGATTVAGAVLLLRGRGRVRTLAQATLRPDFAGFTVTGSF